MDPKTAIRVLAEARTWIGTPYHYRGMAKGYGCDCGSFLYLLYGQFGLKMGPYPLEYAADWCLHRDDERYIDFAIQYTKQIDTPSPGDLVVFRYGRAYSHGGIVTEKRTVIHAWGRTQVGFVMESPWSFFNYGERKIRPRKYYEVPL